MAPLINFYHLAIFAFVYLFIQLPWFLWWLVKGAISMRPAVSVSIFTDLVKRVCEIIAGSHLHPFKHQPLPSKDGIRLLKVERWSWGVLHCSLHSFPLESSPAYTALSYTWADTKFSFIRWLFSWYGKIRNIIANFDEEVNSGRPASLETIIKSSTSDPLSDEPPTNPGRTSQVRMVICNGKALYMTQNLYNALVMIPRSGERTEPYWWIDQICIDQSNVEEKNIQVPMMGRIYRRASNVAAWLGTPWFFERWTPDAVFRRSEYAPFSEGNTSGRFWYQDWDLLRGYISLLVTFGRAWFQRVWIVQELILAKELTFFLGERSIAMDDLVTAARRFDHFFNFHGLHMVQPIRTHAIVEIFDARKSFDVDTGWSFEKWIQMSRGRQASDRRDFLFAGLSLLHENKRSLFKVDYSKTAQEVFVDITKRLLLDEMGTEALCVSDRGGYSRYWMSQAQNSWEINLNYATLCDPLPRSHFSADPSQHPSKAEVDESGHASVLHIQGVVVDKIDMVCDLPGLWCNVSIDELARIVLAIGDKYSSTDENTFEAVARTLTADQCFRDGLSPAHVASRLVGLLTTLILSVTPDHQISDFGGWPEVTFGRLDKTEEGPRKIGHYYHYQDLKKVFPKYDWETVWDTVDKQAAWDELYKHSVTINGRAPPSSDKYTPIMRTTTKGRTLFKTTKGLVGLGSSNTEPGDEVAILQGSRVPFILSQASQYRKAAVEVKHLAGTLRGLVDTFEVPHDLIELAQSKGKKQDEAKIAQFDQVLRHRVLQSFRMFTERSDGIIFKGEAYVHGLMNGEIANMMKEDQSLIWKELVIC